MSVGHDDSYHTDRLDAPTDTGAPLVSGVGCILKQRHVVMSLLVIGLLVPICIVIGRNVLILRDRARDKNCQYNIQLMALDLRHHVDEYGVLPSRVTVDAEGKPIQSWRLRVMQMREGMDVSVHMALDQPWHAPKNRRFLSHYDNASQFRSPSSNGKNGITQYVAIYGDGTIWSPSADLNSIPSPTLLVFEWPMSDIYWAEPRDLSVQEFRELLKDGQFRRSTHALRYVGWDCKMRHIPITITKTELDRLLFPSRETQDEPEIWKQETGASRDNGVSIETDFVNR